MLLGHNDLERLVGVLRLRSVREVLADHRLGQHRAHDRERSLAHCLREWLWSPASRGRLWMVLLVTLPR